MVIKTRGIKLSEKQRLSWLQLIRSENVGPQTFRQLIERFGSAEQALLALPDLVAHGGGRKIRIAKASDAERELDFAQRNNIHFIGIGEPDYPPLLRAIDNPPPLISAKGNLKLLQKTAIGIVGSRNASAAGQKLASQFAASLGEAGLISLSGFARGIDGAAHQSSLNTGTIAVMAGGVDHIYPPEHGDLYQHVLKRGSLVISEMPIGWQPRAQDFPRRNRLIAGIGLGLLVVEAAKRSGSLITARLAADYGRLVFAIPGSPLDPRAVGTNGLIKEGASLVDCAKDIIESLTPLCPEMTLFDKMLPFELTEAIDQHLLEVNDTSMGNIISMTSPQISQSFSLNNLNHCDLNNSNLDDDLSKKERQVLLGHLSVTPIDMETLALYCDLSLPKVYLAILELDLAGKVLRHSGGLVSLAPDF
ncbi:DNA-processing protein DprA [Bartonella sp. HY406]|uniref:DNA-processing protein DprA n=1 Tax=Bartonella sp. HY406 TaxID=2979331 RepID=UPI0021C90219|nr:DNA-processing protein DprA [Bartonella sp. HY406]UXN04759.1 DNA-processing protein DprA [Bartonella sp. HY406]